MSVCVSVSVSPTLVDVSCMLTQNISFSSRKPCYHCAILVCCVLCLAGADGARGRGEGSAGADPWPRRSGRRGEQQQSAYANNSLTGSHAPSLCLSLCQLEEIVSAVRLENSALHEVSSTLLAPLSPIDPHTPYLFIRCREGRRRPSAYRWGWRPRGGPSCWAVCCSVHSRSPASTPSCES